MLIVPHQGKGVTPFFAAGERTEVLLDGLVPNRDTADDGLGLKDHRVAVGTRGTPKQFVCTWRDVKRQLHVSLLSIEGVFVVVVDDLFEIRAPERSDRLVIGTALFALLELRLSQSMHVKVLLLLVP